MRESPPARNLALDGVRAVAALTVVAYHLASDTGRSVHSLPLAELKAGVAIFFVISGYVLYAPFARAIATAGTPPDARSFARRRAARLLPAYWAALAGWAAATLAAGTFATTFGGPSDWWRSVLLVQSYGQGSMFKGLGVAWSLCVEVAFSVALPVLAAAFARLAAVRGGGERGAARTQLLALGVLGAAALLARAGLTAGLTQPVGDQLVVAATTLPLLFDWFALGMALAVLVATPGLAAPLRPLADRGWLCVALSLSLFAAATPIQGGDYFLPADSLGAHALIGLAAAALVVPVVLGRSAQVSVRLLAARPMVALGTASYGIYLGHMPILVAARALISGAPLDAHLVAPLPVGPTAAVAGMTVAGAAALGAASWRFVERPAIARFRGRPPVRPVAPPTTVHSRLDRLNLPAPGTD